MNTSKFLASIKERNKAAFKPKPGYGKHIKELPFKDTDPIDVYKYCQVVKNNFTLCHDNKYWLDAIRDLNVPYYDYSKSNDYKRDFYKLYHIMERVKDLKEFISKDGYGRISICGERYMLQDNKTVYLGNQYTTIIGTLSQINLDRLLFETVSNLGPSAKLMIPKGYKPTRDAWWDFLIGKDYVQFEIFPEYCVPEYK